MMVAEIHPYFNLRNESDVHTVDSEKIDSDTTGGYSMVLLTWLDFIRGSLNERAGGRGELG